MTPIAKYLTPIVLMVYFLLGLAAVFAWPPMEGLPSLYRGLFASICVAYLIFRGKRYYREFIAKDDE